MWVAPSIPVDLGEFEEGDVFVLTRSAQDFGGAFTGGDVVVVGCSGAGASSSAAGFGTAEVSPSTGAAVLAASPTFVDTEVALTDTLGPGLVKAGICGIAGMIGIRGTAGLTLGLVCAEPCCVLAETGGGTAEEGVVGWVESVSDGAWDVTGVSDSDNAGADGGGSG